MGNIVLNRKINRKQGVHENTMNNVQQLETTSSHKSETKDITSKLSNQSLEKRSNTVLETRSKTCTQHTLRETLSNERSKTKQHLANNTLKTFTKKTRCSYVLLVLS